MLARFVAALIALVCLPTVAYGQQAVNASCFPEASIMKAAAMTAAESKSEVIDISGPAAQRYLDVLNEIPPTSALKGNRIIVVMRKDGNYSISVMLGEGTHVGCVLGIVASPSTHSKAMAASGERAA